jgi:hypothetical protein
VKVLRTVFTVLAIAALPAGAVAVPATATAGTSCAKGWGSLPEAKNGTVGSTIRAVRTGRHACFDRIVFDVWNNAPAYSVQYVADVFDSETGLIPVPLRGGATLEVVMLVNREGQNGREIYDPPNKAELANLTGYRTFRQVAFAGFGYERAHFGLGVRARLPFRTFTLPPESGSGYSSRLVVDVAHSW